MAVSVQGNCLNAIKTGAMITTNTL